MKRDPNTDTPNFFSFARDYLHTYMPTVRGLSPRTIEAYRISLECFLSYLADHDNVEREHLSFDHFDRRHLKAWLAWMVDDRHYASKTIALRLSAVKAFLAYSSHEDITLVALSQAARALKAPAQPRKPVDYLTTPQIRAILAAHTARSEVAISGSAICRSDIPVRSSIHWLLVCTICSSSKFVSTRGGV